MKIILATAVFPPEISDPAAAYVKGLSTRLRAQHTVTIVAYASTAVPVPGTTLLTVSKREALLQRLFNFTCVLYRATEGADVLYLQQSVAAGIPAVIVAWLRRIPLVIRCASDEAWERAVQLQHTTKPLEQFVSSPEGTVWIHLVRAISEGILRTADRVVFPSRHLQSTITNAYGLDPRRTSILYDPAQKPLVLPFPAVPVPHQVMLSTWLISWKGVACAIRAVAKLVAALPTVRLVIVGDGPERATLERLVSELNVTAHVSFLGHVSPAETGHLRRTSAIYVCTSAHDGLPYPLLSSFIAGIPVVAVRSPGIAEAVVDGESGLLVTPNDPDDLAQALTRLLSDDTLRARLVQGGKDKVSNTFSWPAHLHTLETILTEVLRTHTTV